VDLTTFFFWIRMVRKRCKIIVKSVDIMKLSLRCCEKCVMDKIGKLERKARCERVYIAQDYLPLKLRLLIYSRRDYTLPIGGCTRDCQT
jgi:hypothetical protein